MLYDAIVVGSGAAGSFAAKELTEQGLDVLLIEAGRAIDPEADFPLPTRAEHGYASRVLGALQGQLIQVRSPALRARTRDFYVNDRENPYTTPSGRPFNWFRGRQLGGRLHVWGRLVARMSDLEFKAASRDGFGADWPIEYADLEPHYARVERFLGVRGSAGGVEHLPDNCYVGPLPPTEPERELRAAIARKLPNQPVVGARVVEHNPKRTPLALVAALSTGRLTVRTDSIVERITSDPATGRADGVKIVDRRSRSISEAKARTVVLCASTIESVRLMLNSRCGRHPDGVGNSSGNLGRYLMDHTMRHCRGPIREKEWNLDSDPQRDPYDFGVGNGFYMPRFQNLGERSDGYLRGFGIQGAVGRDKAGWHMLAVGETLARRENRVTLDPKKKDAWGIPAAHIDFSRSQNEIVMAGAQLVAMRDVAHAGGLEISLPAERGAIERLRLRLMKGRLLDDVGAFVPGSSIHELGGAGMGEDPSKFVLSPHNQCFDAPNLFVTDGACFVSGGYQNPTLTIMALTVRACGHLARELKAGEF